MTMASADFELEGQETEELGAAVMAWNAFEEFESHTWDKEGSLESYLSGWRSRLSELQAARVIYSDAGLALKLLRQCCLDQDTLEIIIQQLDYDGGIRNNNLLSQVMSALQELESSNRLNLPESDVQSKTANDGNQDDICELDDTVMEKEISCYVGSESPLLNGIEDVSRISDEIHVAESLDVSLIFTEELTDLPWSPASDNNYDGGDNILRPGSPTASDAPPPSSLTCRKCAKSFKSLALVRRHELTHAEHGAYVCEHCARVFKTNDNLRNHVKSVHVAVERRKHVCDVCNASFAYRSFLLKHKRVHAAKTKIQDGLVCPVCRMKFKAKHALVIHSSAHAQPGGHFCGGAKHRPPPPASRLQCNLCSKTFAVAGSLRVHQRIHANDKRHKCQDCDKAFTTAGALNRHVRIHTGERPYRCEVCQKSFVTNSTLKNHKKVHVKL